MIISEGNQCPVCGVPLTGRQKTACSNKHRAALSRLKKAESQEDHRRRLRDLVAVLAKEAGLTPEDFS